LCEKINQKGLRSLRKIRFSIFVKGSMRTRNG
jgi:hypothetical protein